jgi:hypothetical protein
MTDPMKALRSFALRYPQAEEGIACQGTALEKHTVKSGGKAFLFVGPTDAMVKLRDSLPDAAALAAKEPARYKVGANGWVKVTFAGPTPLPMATLEAWIDESYRLLAGKGPLPAPAPVGGRRPANRKPAKRRPKK